MAGEYVDLGLSVKWATMNIGAERVIDHGGYFAWGEIGNKEDYTWYDTSGNLVWFTESHIDWIFLREL